ncbi:MAG: TetR family transcriptional regulator [Myxococcota bacterium]
MSDRRRDPEGVRARALEAAIEEFAERGFETGSLRAIARRAGLSQPLISYHFGSKEELWKEVKREVVRRANERLLLEIKRAKGEDPVLSLMRAFFDFAEAEPLARRIGMWAELAGDTDFEGEAALLRWVVGLVERAQAAGILRDDIPAEHLIWIFRSAVYDWLNNRARICEVFGWDPTRPDLDEHFLASMRRMGSK